jgi:hypothetical protein
LADGVAVGDVGVVDDRRDARDGDDDDDGAIRRRDDDGFGKVRDERRGDEL